MAIKINFPNLVLQLLPTHKRQPTRLWWLRTLVAPLGQLFVTFSKWRSDTRMIIKVNSQVGIFEGYLRIKYGQPISIKIVTFEDGALMVCLDIEGDASSLNIALDDTEQTPTSDIPLDGEIRMQFADSDFIVYIPFGVDKDMIQADIERFKQAMVKFKIVQR